MSGKKKKKQHSVKTPVIVSLVILCVLLAALVVLSERQVREKPAPLPQRPLAESLLIKGCLYDLGLERSHCTVDGRRIKVQAPHVYSTRRLGAAFKPLEAYGKVTVGSARRVQVSLDGAPWEITFQYPRPRKKARMAIIVDDMGLSMKVARQLAAIDVDLTYSVMPMRPYSTRVAEYIHGQGHEVMLHLPMEGSAPNPGAGAITTKMGAAEIRAVLFKDLQSVPYIAGVNNHMGSRATADEKVMQLVCRELKKKDLFFIDSLTTSKSVCRPVARDTGIRFNSRDVFLDNVQSSPYICGQLEKLISIAEKNRDAIGICHPHPTTVGVLAKELPKLKKRGIEIVPVSTFVRKQS